MTGYDTCMLVSIISVAVPLLIIAGVLYEIVTSPSYKQKYKDRQGGRALPRTAFDRFNFGMGIVWLALGIENILYEHHRHPTSLRALGIFYIAIGGYFVGLSVPKVIATAKKSKKRP